MFYKLEARSKPRRQVFSGRYSCSQSNIYILIALALDESIILDVPQFPMQNIYQSCNLGRAIGRRNVNASQ